VQLVRECEEAVAEREAVAGAEIERQGAELAARLAAEERVQAALLRRSVRAAKKRAKRKTAQAAVGSGGTAVIASDTFAARCRRWWCRH
jgi:hypothetical protein